MKLQAYILLFLCLMSSRGVLISQDSSVDPVYRLELGTPYFEENIGTEETPLVAQGLAPLSEGLVYYDHGEPTNFEQLMLELVNRARSDPGAEADRFGIDLNEGLSPGTIEDTPKPPLAPNIYLTASARLHSIWMLDADIFSHTGEGGSTPSERIGAAGYALSGSWTTGENIATVGTTGTVDLAQMTLQMHQGLFESSSHRTNICKAAYQEVGIGIEEGLFFSQGTNWKSGMTTQNFGTSSATPGPFVTGVVYEDENQNDTYDLGEGLEGVEVSLTGSGYYAESSASGGYALPFDGAAGSQEVTFTGPGWEESMMVILETGKNLKVDLIADEVQLPWYDSSVDLGGDWRWYDWLGSFNVSNDPWIYHAQHGWLYPFADGPDDVYFWDSEMGSILWTSESAYPSIYRFSDSQWLFYQKGSSNPRWFVNLLTEQWEQW